MRVISSKDTSSTAATPRPIEEPTATPTTTPSTPTAPTTPTQSTISPLQIFTSEYLDAMNQMLSQQPLEAVLEWCCDSLPNFAQLTSFGAAGMVVIHALHKLGRKVPTIFLDTLYHFEETLQHAREVGEKYNMDVHWYRCKLASTRADFERIFKSNDMWISNPHKYEQLTKVEPLERALDELNVSCWMSGRRRDQGGLRDDLQILEIDGADGRLKVNPLAYWTKDEVWAYLKREGVPYNPLFDKSYTSIGDSVNTQQSNGQGERSGRFYQTSGKTECGIHTRSRASPVLPTNTDAPLTDPSVM